MVGLGQWGPGLPVRATLSSPGLGQVPPVQIGVLWIEQPAPPATPVEGNLLVARGEMATSDQVTWLLARLSWGLRAVASRPADPHRLSPPPGLSPPTPFFLGRTRAGGDENLGRFKFLILPGEQRLTQPGWERLPRRGHVGGLSAEGLAEGGVPGSGAWGPQAPEHMRLRVLGCQPGASGDSEGSTRLGQAEAAYRQGRLAACSWADGGSLARARWAARL